MGEAAREPTSAIRYTFTRDVCRRNCLIAFGVGCLLTLANQFDVLLGGPLTWRLGMKVFVNFLIPFVVASTSAAVNRQPQSQYE
jgi:hypothetical protein